MKRSTHRNLAALVASVVVGAAMSLPGPARAADPIVIGSVMDLTGPVATLGQYAKRGVDIAVAEINAEGGVKGHPLQIVSLNSESKPDLAASLGLQLAGRSDVTALIGGSFGATQLALGSIAQKQHIPLVTPTGYVNDDQKNWKYAFFTLVDFRDAVEAMLKYCKSKDYTRIGLLRLEREYGELGSKYLHQYASQYGATIVAEERASDGDRDFTAQLTKIREAKPDVLVVWFANPGGSLVLKNARQIGIHLPMLAPVSMDSSATVKIAGPAANGLVITSQIASAEALDRQKQFAAEYRKAYPEVPYPNTFEAIGYDLVKIVAKAIENTTPPYTREKVRDAIATLNYNGAGTVIHYSATQNEPSAETIVLTKIENGKFVLAK